jgi:lipoprotein-releasing system permease protein
VNLPYEIFVALRYLRARSRQGYVSVITLISTLGVAVGVAALIIAQAMMTGFYEEIQAKIIAGNPHLMVWSDASGEPIAEVEAAAARLSAVPGVEATAPVILGNGLAVGAAGRDPAGIEVLGIEPGREAEVSEVARRMIEGRLEDLTADGGGIVLGADLAEHLGVGMGDQVRLVLPEVHLTPLTPPMARSRLFRVTGLYALGFYQWDAGRAYIHIEAARGFLARLAPGEASAIEVRVSSVAGVPKARAGVEAALGEGFHVGDVIERNRDFFRALRTEKVWMFLAIGLIIVVACLNIVSTLVLMVMEKVRAIGALVAMGAQVRGIMAVFMLQGIFIGAVGTLAGVGLGTSFCWVLDRYQLIRLSPEVYFIAHVPFRTGPGDVALAAGLACAVSFLATLYPAFRAASLDPVQALRHE